jgi:hypothetical protein
MEGSREEIEKLLNYLMPFAEERLNRDGEFYPYAAMVAADGELKSGSAAEGEDPDVADLLVALHQELRDLAAEGSIRASGIAADVTLTDPDSGKTTDAVQLELDHAEGDAVDVYVPYESASEGVRFGDLVSAKGREPVFSSGASQGTGERRH